MYLGTILSLSLVAAQALATSTAETPTAETPTAVANALRHEHESRLNPPWEENHLDRDSLPGDIDGLYKRGQRPVWKNTVCEPSLGEWRKAFTFTLLKQIQNIRGWKGFPRVPGKQCKEVIRDDVNKQSSIWLCNDNAGELVLPGYADVADAAQRSINICGRKKDYLGYPRTFSQQFAEGNWNVIVKADNFPKNPGKVRPERREEGAHGSSLIERGQRPRWKNTVCTPSRNEWRKAFTMTLETQIQIIRGWKGFPRVPAKQCKEIIKDNGHGQSSIWLCNDNSRELVLPGYADLADAAQRIINICKTKDYLGLDRVFGQQFAEGNWNVIAKANDYLKNPGKYRPERREEEAYSSSSSSSSSLIERGQRPRWKNTVCEPSQSEWRKAFTFTLDGQIQIIRGWKGFPRVPAKQCKEIIRDNKRGHSAIWLCNDNNSELVLPGYADLADAAQRIINICKTKDYLKFDRAFGQQFAEGNWNVIVKADNYPKNPGRIRPERREEGSHGNDVASLAGIEA